MALYSAFRIKDTSGVRIPSKFLIDFNHQKSELSKMKDDLPLSEQQYFSISIISEINPMCKVTNDEELFNDFEDDDIKLFFFDGKYMYLQGEEKDIFKFELDGDYFRGCDEFYSASNYGWTKKLIEDLIKKFKGTVLIEDMGDEEDGFVNNKGCSRELIDETWIDGIKQ